MYKILGHDYKIEFSPDSHLERTGAGSCNTNQLKIKISNIVPMSVQEEALLHETFEALNYHLGLELEHYKITALSEGLYSVERDNAMLNLLKMREIINGLC